MKAARSVTRFPFSWALFCALAIAVCTQTGCRSVSETCSSVLHLGGSDTTETVEYPGPERFWNKAGLVISPTRIVAQVGTEVPMFAGVCDNKGQLQPFEKVEWMLDPCSVGSFASVNEPMRPLVLDLVGSKTGKVDNNHAISETLPANVILTRGTPNIDDDTVMPRGYTWVTVTSPVDGESHITAFAPDVYSWAARHRSATIHWIDAEWCFPEAGCVPPGAHAALVTCVFRKTNKMPVSNWIVRYTITGGAEAGFGPDNAQSKEIASDGDGKATVELIPTGTATGTTCVNVELIRPECESEGTERLSIASAATHVNWTNTNLSLRIVGPNEAVVGSTANYRIEVTNPGGMLANDVAVTIAPPSNTAFVKSDPAPDGTAGPLTWRLGQVRGSEAKVVTLDLRIDQPGPLKVCASLTAADGLTAESCGTTNVLTTPAAPAATFGAPPAIPPTTNPPIAPPRTNTVPPQPPAATTAPPAQPPAQIAIAINGPKTAQLASDIEFNVQITNRGNLPATGLGISDRYDEGLQHTSNGALDHSPITQRVLGDIAPGQSTNLRLVFRAIKPGNLCHTVEVTGPNGLHQSQQSCVLVSPEQTSIEQPAMNFTLTVPQQVYRVGDRFRFAVLAANTGNVTPARDARIEIKFEDALRPESSTPGGEKSADGRSVVFAIPTIPAGKQELREVECVCVAPTPRACGRVTYTDASKINFADERCVQIVAAAGAPVRQSNLQLEIIPLTNPVRLGGEATFSVVITNRGSNSERQVKLGITAADSLTYIGSTGPVRESKIDGSNVQFEAIKELRAGEKMQPLVLHFKTNAAGSAQVTAEISSPNLDQPLARPAAINIIAE